LIKDMEREQNWLGDAAGKAGKGVARLARQRADRIGWCTAALLTLASLLGACSADLSLNNITLAPKPEPLPRKPDGSAQTWGRSSFDSTVSIADLVGPEGQCSAAGSEQTAAESGAAAGEAHAAQLALGGISLRMTECDVVRRAGAVEKIDLGANERGERSLVLTYLRGPWPGVYRFAGGRLVSIERASAAPAAPEKPHKAINSAKKPAGT
jgi:hypothetical protein